MGDIRNEPSMEEILASIKRIIAEDSVIAPSVPRGRRGSQLANAPFPTQEAVVPQPAAKPIVDDNIDEEVLELTESMDVAPAPEPEAPTAEEQPVPKEAATKQEPAPNARLVSESALSASRSALASLSALIVKPESNGDNTLDGLVREMLRPMLKEWLDARLPELVEQIVEKEVARITGRVL
jgi:cell pole-organizing protein PopZ